MSLWYRQQNQLGVIDIDNLTSIAPPHYQFSLSPVLQPIYLTQYMSNHTVAPYCSSRYLQIHHSQRDSPQSISVGIVLDQYWTSINSLVSLTKQNIESTILTTHTMVLIAYRENQTKCSFFLKMFCMQYLFQKQTFNCEGADQRIC